MRLKPKLKAPAQGKTLSGHHFTLWKRLLNQGLKPKLKAPAQGKILLGHHFELWQHLLNQGSNRSSKRLSNKQWCLEGFELLRDFGYYNTKSKGRPAKCAKDAPAGRRILVRPSFQSPCLPLSLCLSHSLILCGNSRHKLSTSYF